MSQLEYKEGYEAFNDGLSSFNNPYKQDDSEKYNAWLEGFCKSEDDEFANR